MVLLLDITTACTFILHINVLYVFQLVMAN